MRFSKMLQLYEDDPSSVVLEWEDFEISCLQAFQKIFNRSFKEFEFSPPVRAGDVKRVIISQLNQRTNAFCSSQRTFAKVRQALTRGTGLNRSQVKLDEPLEHYFPKSQRKKSWKKVKKAIGLPFPNLKVPPFARWALSVSFCFAPQPFLHLIGIL